MAAAGDRVTVDGRADAHHEDDKLQMIKGESVKRVT